MRLSGVRPVEVEGQVGLLALSDGLLVAIDLVGSPATGVTSRIGRRPATGLGEDFELAADGLIGSGVWLDGRPAHFSVFAPA